MQHVSYSVFSFIANFVFSTSDKISVTEDRCVSTWNIIESGKIVVIWSIFFKIMICLIMCQITEIRSKSRLS